jgi:hypothetical protein
MQGYMFQLHRAIIRPLPKNRSISPQAIILQHCKLLGSQLYKKSDMDLFFGRGLMMALWS